MRAVRSVNHRNACLEFAKGLGQVLDVRVETLSVGWLDEAMGLALTLVFDLAFGIDE